MIATAHPLASAAGLAMLKQGGNAIDAAVAASFVISVVRPQSTGIGGGGFLLDYLAASRATEVYDFRERAPARATRTMYLDAHGVPKGSLYRGSLIPNASVNGPLAVGVPGIVKGLLEAQARRGRLPLKVVMQPAIDIAAHGFPVYAGLAKALHRCAAILKHFPGSVKVFFHNGQPLAEGDILVQKDLAWTLGQIAAKGADGFYKGEVARRIVAEMRRGDGIVSQTDLDLYKVRHPAPVTGFYRGYRIVSMPPPSSGGVHIIEIMHILAPENYGAMGFGTVRSVHWLAEAMRRAFADRAAYLGDPAFVAVPLKGLLSPAYGRKLHDSIDPAHATRSAALKPGRPMDYESPSTTHISVIDAWGNAVSTTQTINYTFGSCVVAEGTGIVLNDEMDDFAKKPGVPNAYGLVGSEANSIAARKTPLSSMSPTLVFDPQGHLELAVGSPGGPRIISATLQTILNVIDFKMPLADAVHATRIHNQWLPDRTQVEPGGLTPAVQAELTRMGHHIVVGSSIGDVQAVGYEGGHLVGVSDTRAEGKPEGY